MRPTLRWRSHGRQEGQKGFSLVELMVVIGILAILLAIAVPRYSAWRASTALQSAAETLMAHLKQTRVMAVAGNRDVYIAFSAAGYTVDSTGTQPQQYNLSSYGAGLSLSATSSSLNFNSNGTASAGTVTLSDVEGDSKAITVNIVGRVHYQ